MPTYGDLYVNLGSVLWNLDKSAEAEKILRAGLKLPADDLIKFLLHYNLADVLFGTYRFEAAVGEYREALKLDKEDADSRTGLSKSLVAQGISLNAAKRWHEAELAWREVAQMNPKNTEIQYHFAWTLMQQKKFTAAETMLQKIVAANPKTEKYKDALGTCFSGQALVLLNQNKDAAAEAKVRQILLLKPNDVPARSILGFILTGQGKFQEAEKEARQMLRIEPKNGEAHVLLAECLLALKRPEEARVAAKAARDLGVKNNETLAEVEKKLSHPSQKAHPNLPIDTLPPPPPFPPAP